MEILDVAIELEQKGQRFYMESAARMDNPAAKRMLLSLAIDEVRHEQTILTLKSSSPHGITDKTFAGIQGIFEQLVAAGENFKDKAAALTGVLKEGLVLETESKELYERQAAKTTGPIQAVWKQLAAEEAKHEKLLRLTLEYIDKPNIVLENAEFLFYDHDIAP